MIIGLIGLGLLLLAYLLLNSKHSKWFIPVDTIASFIITFHAFLINDLPFLIVNAFIALSLAYKWYKREYEVTK